MNDLMAETVEMERPYTRSLAEFQEYPIEMMNRLRRTRHVVVGESVYDWVYNPTRIGGRGSRFPLFLSEDQQLRCVKLLKERLGKGYTFRMERWDSMYSRLHSRALLSNYYARELYDEFERKTGIALSQDIKNLVSGFAGHFRL
jgi:hypothetical protein